MTNAGTTVAPNYFRVVTLIQGLAFEVRVPGMRMTRVALLPIAKEYGFKGNKKIKALAFMDEYARKNFPAYVTSERVQELLDAA